VLLLQRGLAPSRAQAHALVMAGEVRINGERADKPGMKVPTTAHLEIIAPLPYVSRGGIKLAAALDAFRIDPHSRLCADVGASTGGFCDVLLQRGAAHVYAIDVGYGQLDWRLRQDARVSVLERTNARHLESLPEMVSLVTVDVSFISLRLILPAVRNWLAPSWDVVVLIKPQFEAGRKQVGKGGIVKDPTVHAQVLSDILEWGIANGFQPAGLIPSPIEGASGNREFLAWLRAEHGAGLDISQAIERLLLSPEPDQQSKN